MSRTDAAYQMTRRDGDTVANQVTASITRITGDGAFDPETFENTQTTETTTLRWIVKEMTATRRFVRAQATKQDVGETTFIMWANDLTFSSLDADDFITYDGVNYQVRTSKLEDKTAFVVTADEIG